MENKICMKITWINEDAGEKLRSICNPKFSSKMHKQEAMRR
jgi:hypothetical protein